MSISFSINELKKYIEILLLIILTVGPFPPIVKKYIYFIVLFMNIRHIGTLRHIRLLYFIVIISMIIPMIIDIRNVDSTTPYAVSGFAFLAPFVFSIVYIKAFERNEFLSKLEKVIFFITIVSLIGYLLVLFMPSIIEQFPTVTYYGRRVKTIGLFGAIRDYTQATPM